MHRKRRRKQHSAMMPDNRITYITDLVPLDLWMYICNAIYIPDSGNNCTLAQVLALLHYTADPHAAIEMFYSQAAQPDLVVLHPRSTQWPDGGYECMNRNGLMRFCSGIVAANTTQVRYKFIREETDAVPTYTLVNNTILSLMSESENTDKFPDLLVFPKHLTHFNFGKISCPYGIISSTATHLLKYDDIIYENTTHYILSDITKKSLYYDFINMNGQNHLDALVDGAEDVIIIPPKYMQHVPCVNEYKDLLEYVLSPATKTICAEAFRGTPINQIDLHWPSLTKLGKDAFALCGCLRCKIVLSDNIKQIPETCFFLAPITSITLSSQLTYIAECGLSQTNIESLQLPPLLRTLGNAFCAKCKYLNDVDATQAWNLKKIPPRAFAICVSLERVLLPPVTYIGEEAFEECRCLKTVTVQDAGQLLLVKDSAFAICVALEELTIPAVCVYGENVFQQCESLARSFIVGGKHQPHIPDGLFLECRKLKTICIVNGTQSIGSDTFSHCDQLINIHIGKSVTRMGNNTFRGCSALKNMTFDRHFHTFGDSAFRQCTNLETVTMMAPKVYLGPNLFTECSALTTFTVPPQTTHLPENTFYKCENLKKVILSPHLTSIDAGCFWGTDTLVTCDFTALTKLTAIGYNLFNFTALTSLDLSHTKVESLYTMSNMIHVKTILLPVSLTSLCDGQFCNCTSLQSITLPPQITCIPTECFLRCSSLKTVDITTLEENIELCTEAFRGCTVLHNVYFSSVDWPTIPVLHGHLVLPATVSLVGIRAFMLCNAITHVSNDSPLTTFACCSFMRMYGLVCVNMTTRMIFFNMFEECTALRTVHLSEKVEKLGFGAFSGCSSLVTVERDTSDRPFELCESAFDNCTSLTGLKNVPRLSAIKEDCFRGCTSLEQFPLDECRHVATGAFFGSGLKSVALPVVDFIGAEAFKECKQMTRLFVGSTLKTLRQGAFSDTAIPCVHITTGKFCSTKSAFSQCKKLKAVYFYTEPVTKTSPVFATDAGTINIIPQQSYHAESVTLGAYFFSECSALVTCKLPPYIHDLGSGCLQHTGLQSMWIPTTVHRISNFAFHMCSDLRTVTFEPSANTPLNIDDNAFMSCTALESVTFTRPIPKIERAAFHNCVKMQHVRFEDAVYIVGWGVFGECSKLGSVDFGTHPHTNLYLESEVFRECGQLTEVIFPPIVNTIMSSAFRKCRMLSNITLPTNDMFTTLDEDVFGDCDALVELTIPPNITNICLNSIPNVKNLTINHPDASVPIVFHNLDENLRNLQRLEYNVNTSSYPAMLTPNLERVMFHSSLTKLPPAIKYMRDGKQSIFQCVTAIDLSATKIQTIPAHCFYECTQLTTVTLSKVIHTIEEYAFCRCSALEEVVNLDVVHSIGENAFANCKELESCIFGPGLVFLGEDAFEKCYSLKYVEMVRCERPVFFGKHIFYMCNSLRMIWLPPANATLDLDILMCCNALRLIMFPTALCTVSNLHLVVRCCKVTLATRVPYINDDLRKDPNFYAPNMLTS